MPMPRSGRGVNNATREVMQRKGGQERRKKSRRDPRTTQGPSPPQRERVFLAALVQPNPSFQLRRVQYILYPPNYG